MSKYTLTRKNRAVFKIIKKNNEDTKKIVGYRLPAKLDEIEFTVDGKKLKTFIAQGQIINSRKEYKRQIKNNWQ